MHPRGCILFHGGRLERARREGGCDANAGRDFMATVSAGNGNKINNTKMQCANAVIAVPAAN